MLSGNTPDARFPSSLAAVNRMSVPVSVVTMTITDTLESLKSCDLTIISEGMLRSLVLNPSTAH